jgi:hypothetical protein
VKGIEMTDINKLTILQEDLWHHMSEEDDPCCDRGVEFPCDVASALSRAGLILPESELKARREARRAYMADVVRRGRMLFAQEQELESHR